MDEEREFCYGDESMSYLWGLREEVYGWER